MNDYEARPARMPRRAIALAVTSVIAFGLVAAGAVYLWMRDTDAVVAAGPSASPSPSRLDTSEACVLLVPTLDDAADQVLALVNRPDGTTVDWARVGTIADDFKTIGGVAPADMSADVGLQRATMQRMLDIKAGSGGPDLQLGDFRASGLRLAARCG